MLEQGLALVQQRVPIIEPGPYRIDDAEPDKGQRKAGDGDRQCLATATRWQSLGHHFAISALIEKTSEVAPSMRVTGAVKAVPEIAGSAESEVIRRGAEADRPLSVM